MGAIDNVVAHFDAQEVNSFEVPEWGTDGKPLVIYAKPLTLHESKNFIECQMTMILKLWFMQ